jgi:hypothetical protein
VHSPGPAVVFSDLLLLLSPTDIADLSSSRSMSRAEQKLVADDVNCYYRGYERYTKGRKIHRILSIKFIVRLQDLLRNDDDDDDNATIRVTTTAEAIGRMFLIRGDLIRIILLLYLLSLCRGGHESPGGNYRRKYDRWFVEGNRVHRSILFTYLPTNDRTFYGSYHRAIRGPPYKETKDTTII